MTNRIRSFKGYSLLALAAAASIPAMIACGGGSSASGPAAAPSAGPYGAAANGYPQQPGAYPQQPGAYPQQPGAYPQQPGAYPQQPQQGAYPQQPQQGAYPQQPGAAPAQPGATAPMGSVVTTDPNALAALFAQAAQAGQAILTPPGSAPIGDPVDICLAASAAKHAKGMQAEGSVAKGQLTEGGQHLDFMVTMQPGKCYTVIGCSATVKNLDLAILAPPLYNFLAGQDTTDNNMPVVGGSPNPMCPVIPMPLTYKIDISARSGSGNVGAQVYSKNK